jgi:REP element-mobilizing transposase RayT
VKLNLHKRGRKFFFITICTEERRRILSHINEDGTVTLTPIGEAIAEVWRTSHSRNEAVTASNFIIMPDHIHLLLIVNYDKAPSFDIIDWIHEFNRLVNETGLPPRAPHKEQTPSSTGFGAEPRPIATAPRPIAPLSFRFYLMLSFSPRQLQAFRRYIKLNPARALWKKRNPDRFIKRGNIRHAILPKNRVWDAIGNLTLLPSPLLLPIRLTRKKTVEEHSETINDIIEKARKGMIPISGFISPGEREVLRRLKEEPSARFIKMLPYALPPRYDPSAEDSRELAADRLLILSGFPQTVSANDKIARTNCLLMNDLIVTLCENAQTLK